MLIQKINRINKKTLKWLKKKYFFKNIYLIN